MRYRRSDIKGGTYFFTVNLVDRQNTLLADEIDKLQNIMKKVKQQHPFKIDVMAVLPDYLHAIWTLPANDNDYAGCWMLIKSGYSRQIPKQERRYWEHLIRDKQDYEKHVDYVHYNPVKHGYLGQ